MPVSPLLLLTALVALFAPAEAGSSKKTRGHRKTRLTAPRINHIYPMDHWSYVTQMTEDNFDQVVNDALENNRTLMVRWISSPQCGPCRVQAKAWDRVVRLYKGDEAVVFGDVNIEEHPTLAVKAGMPQQPTIRAFTTATGPEGIQYSAKAPYKFHTISQELTNDHYMVGYVEDARRQSRPCQVDGVNCDDASDKSQAYIARVRSALTTHEQEQQLSRLEQMVTRQNLPGDVMSWANQRIRLLRVVLGLELAGSRQRVAEPDSIKAEL